MIAVQSGEMETACELIGTDAEVNARSYDGRAPLMYAAMAGHAGIVAALIAAARSR
jgi:ankyrin repeat protein